MDREQLFGGALYLGCPQWAHRPWTESIFPAESAPRDALAHYARAFNTVEGNTTFYAVPPRELVERWVTQCPPSFKMALKFPKEVTHDRLLGSGALDVARRFLDHMSPLGERLKHTIIQLPAHFDERGFETLYYFLSNLPRRCEQSGAERHYLVELRAPSLCSINGHEARLFHECHDLLSAVQTERMWMDTRPLRAAPATFNEEVIAARSKKPDLPVYPVGLGPNPAVRFVAHPEVEANRPWLSDWADVFMRWIHEGRRPFFFAHYPGETLAPQVADLFYQLLRDLIPTLPERNIWPSERQQSLF